MVEVIRLGAPRGGDDIIRLGKKPKSFKDKLTSGLIRTATLQAGVLGTLVGGPVTGLKSFALTGLGLGVLQSSPKARKFAKEKFVDPAAGGRFIGTQIETGFPKDKKPFKERVVEGAKKAGLIGAIGAGVVGATAVGKSLIERSKKAKIPNLNSLIPISPSLITQQPLPVVTAQQQPLGAAQKVKEKEKPVATAIMPTINNKISVKPEINVRINQSKKFINQQNLFRR